MSKLQITHRFDLLHPGRTIGAATVALSAGLVGHVLGPWGSLAAVGALIATGAVSITLPGSVAEQGTDERGEVLVP